MKKVKYFIYILKSFILAAILLNPSGFAYSQNYYCGFDIVNKNKSIAEKNKIIAINQIIYNSIQNKNSLRNQSTNSILTIPVVFHVIHENGPENITDSAIYQLLNQLNLRYQNSAPYFDSTGTSIGIQFCLASIDPLGNPTTGITRHYSSYTNLNWTGPYANEIPMKSASIWNPRLYLNIWTVKTIVPSATGYSSYPSDAGKVNDGIVIQYQSSVGQPTLLTHEVGHYLGLYHTFEGSSPCINYNCLLDGDRVCDTPPDVSVFGNCNSNSCSTEISDTSGFSPFIADVNDLPNYMDYTLCPLSFTPGQSIRMNSTLNVLRHELLQSNGCGSNPGGVIPIANFSHELTCSGEKFINTSTNSLFTEWDFNNDGTYDMTGDTVFYNFPQSGTFTIKMRVTGFGGADSISQLSNILVRISPTYPILYKTGYSFSPYTGNNYSCKGNQINIYGWPSMSSYLWSNGATTQNISFVADSSFDISLTAIDMDGNTWTSCPTPIHVEVAPLLTKPTISISADTVCVLDSVYLNASIQTNQYVYSWNVNSNEINSSSVFFNTILNSGSNFVFLTIRDVNGCKINSDTSFIYADSTIGCVPNNISFSHEMTCSGEKFINTTSNSLSAEWDFNNDGIYDLTGDTVYHNFPQSGAYTIKLRVTNQGGVDSTSQLSYIQVRISPTYPILNQTGYSVSPYTGINYSCKGNQITIYGWPSMASYLWSNGSTTQNISFVADSSFGISLTAVDIDGHTWTSCPTPIHVEVAPLLTTPIINISSDSICVSDSAHLNASIQNNQYVYSWNINSSEIISYDVSFNTLLNSGSNIVFLTIRDINGCKINSDTILIYADSIINEPYFITQIGDTIYGNPNSHNQFYKDGVPIQSATNNQYLVTESGCYSVLSWYHNPDCAVMSDSICITITEINDTTLNRSISVFPNPAKNYINIKGLIKEQTSFSIFNSTGQRVLIQYLNPNTNMSQIQLNNLSNGIYYWEINEKSGGSVTGKIIINK